jgi:hypothetical protein
MRKPQLKKSFMMLTLASLTLAAILSFGLMGRQSASANSDLELSSTFNSSAAGIAFQTSGVVLPKNNIYLLNDDNTLFVLTPGSTSFTRLVRVNRD